MKVKKTKIEDLRHDPNNARRHSDRNIEAVVNSLRRFGQQKPIVTLADGTVIAGNATLKAATSLGWSHVASVVFDGDKDEATAYALADNRTAELANWDWAVLGDQLDHFVGLDGIDLADVGWTAEEAGSIIGTIDFTDVPDGELDKVAEDEPGDNDDSEQSTESSTADVVVTIYDLAREADARAAISQAIEGLPAVIK